MKVATFNIQNIFSRSKRLLHLKMEDDSERFTREFDDLLYTEKRTEGDYQRMRKLAEILGFKNEIETRPDRFIGQGLPIKKKEGGNMLSYNARALFEGKRAVHPEFEPIDLDVVERRAQAIKQVDADILVLQEVESRKALLDLDQYFLKENRNGGYGNILFMPTNDPYGRGMGLLLKKDYSLKSMATHVNEKGDNGGPLFDKDLQEYNILSPSGRSIKILNVHFQCSCNTDEKAQVQILEQVKKTKRIIEESLNEGKDEVIVLGTLNGTRESGALSELLSFPTLKQITLHRTFRGNEKPGISDQEPLEHMLIMRSSSGNIASSGILRRKDMSNEHGILWAKWNHAASARPLKRAA